MSRSFLTSIDLNKNELLNAKIQNLSTAPSSPTEGQVYYNTNDKAVYQYNGTAWKKLVNSGEIVNGDIASGAAIALSKLATDPLARANHTGTQTASTISDFDTQVRTNRLDQMSAPTASVSMNTQKITNLATPVNATDAANKGYVDNAVAGLTWKSAAHLLAATNIALTGTSGTLVIDGHSALDGADSGYRILLTNQSTAADNGIYVYDDNGTTYALTRATDADVYTELINATIFIQEGTTYADTTWTQSNHYLTSFSSQSWVQINAVSSYTAGNGLNLTGNSFSVVGTADRISVSGSGVDIASTYAGQTSITTLGTVSTGTWNASTIGVAKGGTGATTLTGYVKGSGTSALTASSTIPVSDLSGTLPVGSGGTGATTLTGYLKGNGASAVTASSTIPGSDVNGNISGNAANVTGTVAIANGGTGSTTATDARSALGATGKYAVSNPSITVSGGIATWTVTHNLGSQDVIVQVREVATNAQVEVDVVLTSTTQATLTWASTANIAANTYRVVVVG